LVEQSGKGLRFVGMPMPAWLGFLVLRTANGSGARCAVSGWLGVGASLDKGEAEIIAAMRVR